MSKLSIEQRRITHRGTVFHFVAYGGQSGSPKGQEPPTETTWYLMREGRRWEVASHHPGQDDADIVHRLTRWLDEHVYGLTPGSQHD